MWCGLCKEGFGSDAVFCGDCGSRLEDRMSEVTREERLAELRDADQLAREVYDYWVETLRTDGYDAENIDRWDDLDDAIRQNFVEAIDKIVVRPLDRVVTDMEVELSMMEAVQAVDAAPNPAKAMDVPKSHRCYTCGRSPVASLGDICAQCRRL